ncbi:MAG: hypothetical protein AAF078_02410 [Planctomycetota bacterium]
MSEVSDERELSAGPAGGRERADRLPGRMGRRVVMGMGLAMVALIVAITLMPATQVRYVMPTGVEWGEGLIVEYSRRALRQLGHEPIEAVVPNPDAGGAGAGEAAGPVAVDPGNAVYETIYWEVEAAETGERQRWRVTVKQLGRQFIAWPRRVE